MAHLVQPPIALGFDFDGVDDYIDCGTDPSLICPEAITILAWVNLASTGKLQSVADRFRSATNAGYRFSVRDDRKLEVRLGNGTTTLVAVSTKTIEWNKFHRLGMIYDSVTGEVSVWIDGEKEYLTTFSGTLADAERALQISSRWFGTYLKGVVNEVRVFNRALSDSEFSDHYSIRRNIMEGCVLKFATVGLVLGGGTEWLDESAYENNGRVTGARRVRCCHCNVVRDYGT